MTLVPKLTSENAVAIDFVAIIIFFNIDFLLLMIFFTGEKNFAITFVLCLSHKPFEIDETTRHNVIAEQRIAVAND